MPCQNTISPRDNKWNWKCWYGGLKIDNLRSWFFGPRPPISVYYSNSIQFQLLAECLFGIEIIQLLQKRRHPAIESVPLSAKKDTKSSAASAHTLTRPSISLPWKTLHTQTRANTHSHMCRHTNTPKHPSQRNTEARKRQSIWLMKHFPCNSWDKKTTDKFYSV